MLHEIKEFTDFGIFIIPSIISCLLIFCFIPITIIAFCIEKLLIKQKIILPKIKMEFSKKKKIILCVILFLAILAYLVSLGGWIHTMIPYSPEELENLRYD